MDKLYHPVFNHQEKDLLLNILADYSYNYSLRENADRKYLIAVGQIQDTIRNAFTTEDIMVTKPYLDEKFNEIKKLLGA